MKLLKSFLILSLASCFISSCSKDDDPQLSKLEYLTQKPWKLKSVNIVGIGASAPESYQLDDIYTFKTDGSYLFEEGASKGDPSDPQTITGTWEFAQNETVINLSYGGFTFNQQILELNGNTLKVKFTFILELEETFGH